MAETLTKLRPDRDLQCYFEQPSAIAALSEASATGFTVSGCWRQQFDWAVVEWNRDNVFEHPLLRNLPDGDLRGMRLSYEETRTNCVPIDSTIYDAVGWSYLRVWEWSSGRENLHWVPLKPYASPVQGAYTSASVEFELQGSPTVGDYVEISWLDQHANYLMAAGDTLETAVEGLAGFINAKGSAGGVQATAVGRRITLTQTSAAGVNGNRVGVYTGVRGGGTETWSPESAYFSGGISPAGWKIDLDFSALTDRDGNHVETGNVRKLRWTWAADLQFAPFERGEFAVEIRNWNVSGSGLMYRVAGPGSRRIEDNSNQIAYTGTWVEERGNYSGNTIRKTTQSGARAECQYSIPSTHELYLGTRYVNDGGKIRVQVDGGSPVEVDLKLPAEDALIRVRIGQFSSAASHRVVITHSGTAGSAMYFDFLEIVAATEYLPDVEISPATTLATDWDTNHSLAIAPERCAWLIQKLGFKGRANHYVGAMWFYELGCPGNEYASATIEFSGAPTFGETTEITIAGSTIRHTHYITDNADRIAKCFEQLISSGSSAVWAKAEGASLRITARVMGVAGNNITVSANTTDGQFTVRADNPRLAGGKDGRWTTDLSAMPRLNRAVRDWSRSYFRALITYGIDATAAFSTELRHGDDSPVAGIAQRYPSQPCWVNTPALQTNFSPSSLSYWKQVYLDMAQVMSEAGMRPYLQFGEIQWWYFADAEGMPFYDDYTKTRFAVEYGRALQLIKSQNVNPSGYVQECEFLSKLIGEFTSVIRSFVRGSYPTALFEVLYPPDTNDTPLNRLVNFPSSHWTPATLACLKTENFTYTGDRNLDKAGESIELPGTLGFGPTQRSHLVGIGDPTSPWVKEQSLAHGTGIESVVLFALDQFCLVGYSLPLDRGSARAQFMGA